ncbi:PilW family protein [Ottowia thiooxydans]|uniref:Type IV pilus assembly protein PilW n=1 Tax=Ottowia thiooxydans TaxID=219182 RepID=A0ABV2QEY9_9BURK
MSKIKLNRLLRARQSSRQRHRGLTLVEVLVAITLMLLITVATVSLYSVNASSKRTVDGSQQLDDVARFAFHLIGEAARNAGYANVALLSRGIESGGGLAVPGGTVSNLFDLCETTANTIPCPVLGFDNSTVTSSNFGSRNSNAPNASDSLGIRFYGSGADGRTGKPLADGTMRTCNGTAVAASSPGMPTTVGELGLSIFYVDTDSNEPSLYCYSDPGTASRDKNAIVRGVESMQIMYGVDLCLPLADPACSRDGVPDRWVSAADVGDANWRFVKAIRVGLVVRGAPGSAQVSSTAALFPLGADFSNGNTEAGLSFTPPADGRLRRTYVTTFLLRNSA